MSYLTGILLVKAPKGDKKGRGHGFGRGVRAVLVGVLNKNNFSGKNVQILL